MKRRLFCIWAASDWYDGLQIDSASQRALYQQLDEILPLYKSWGASGIKFGFVQVGSQFWTNWMHEAIKKCAQKGLRRIN